MFIDTAYAETDTIAIQGADGEMPAAPQAPETSALTSFVPMILIFAAFYFLLIRPQDKKRRQQEALVLGVKKGEDVLTNSGMFGKVTKINDSDNTIMVQLAKDVEIKMLKNAIADITSRAKKEVVKTDKAPSKKDKSEKKAKPEKK
ncbi:preprotein translocase subunit YajC [Rickettsiaceae bacterium]|nr:preprotein translocase subunit YajC [Rickettsiaceae bacterium]